MPMQEFEGGDLSEFLKNFSAASGRVAELTEEISRLRGGPREAMALSEAEDTLRGLHEQAGQFEKLARAQLWLAEAKLSYTIIMRPEYPPHSPWVERGIRAFEKSFAITPADPQGSLELGHLYAMDDQLDAAVPWLELAQRADDEGIKAIAEMLLVEFRKRLSARK